MTKHLIQSGCGFNVGYDFSRTTEPTPIDIIERRDGNVIGYIDGNPQSALDFMRSIRVRVVVQERFIQKYQG